jgi:hypothetical protein
VAKNTPYLQVRRDVIVDLLLPGSHTVLFLAAAAAGLGASLAQWRRRAIGQMGDELSTRLLAVVHGCIAVMFMIAVVLPLWSMVQTGQVQGPYRATSAVHTWPFALAILYLPWLDQAVRPMAKFLIVAALLLLVGSALVIPTSGGGQWSPRFLLAVAPLLAVVAAACVPAFAPAALRPASATPLRRGRRELLHPRTAIPWTAAAILIGSVVMQATGVALFHRAKTRHAELTGWVANRTSPGYVLITDVFWFHEVTATLTPARRTLFSWSSADVPALAALAASHGIERFGVVSSVPLTGYDPPPVLDVPGAPCRFVRGQRIGLDPNGLTLSRYACEAP